jgi:hypothetical protein
MRIGGIDPGKTGALAFIDYEEGKNGRIVDLVSCPIVNDEMDCHQVLAILADYHPNHVAIEKSQAMRREGVTQGVVSMFNYGMNFGMYIGILIASKIPYTKVPAVTWKREFNLLKKGKEASIAEAQRLFPQDASFFRFKKDHGKADACLLAEFVRRKLRGNIRKSVDTHDSYLYSNIQY